jgi:hypothetical protein
MPERDPALEPFDAQIGTWAAAMAAQAAVDRAPTGIVTY